MNKKILALFATTGMVALTGCSGLELAGATKATPHGSAFDNELSANYLTLSEDEYLEGDYRDSDYFARRSMDAGNGLAVAPPLATDRKLPKGNVAQATAARTDLVRALDGGARTRTPKAAAGAQTAYECWTQELEENFQFDDIAACRERFFTLLAGLEPAPEAPSVSQEPTPEADAVSAQPTEVFRVHFATGSAGLDTQAYGTITDTVSQIDRIENARVVVSGYADTVGSMVDNQQLAQRRANAVASALRSRGVANGAISVNAYGERFPEIESGDSTDEIRNRRVVISVAR